MQVTEGNMKVAVWQLDVCPSMQMGIHIKLLLLITLILGKTTNLDSSGCLREGRKFPDPA